MYVYVYIYRYVSIYIHIYLFIYDLFTWSKDHIGRLFGSLRPTILDLSGLSLGGAGDSGTAGTGDRGVH